jgi:hypothetical protein
MARDPARNDHDAHRAIAPPLDPVRGNVGGAVLGGRDADCGGVLDGGAVAGGAVVVVDVVVGVDGGPAVVVVTGGGVVVVGGGGGVVVVGGGGGVVVVGGDVVLVVVGAVVVVVVLVVVGGAVVVVVGGGATVRSALMVTGVGTARRCEPGAESVRAGPGPLAVARTSPLTGPPVRTAATPSAFVVASKRSAASSNTTATAAIGPPGPARRTVRSAPPSGRTEISGRLSAHGPRRAAASAASSSTAASTSASRPPPATATSTAGPCHTGPPELRWALAYRQLNTLTAAAFTSSARAPPGPA